METILDVIKPIRLLEGHHDDTAKTGQGCFMNVVAYLNGEPQITDSSPCVCPSLRSLLICANDLMVPEDDGHLLLPFIERAMGSKTDDPVELKRRVGLLLEFARKQVALGVTSSEIPLIENYYRFFDEISCDPSPVCVAELAAISARFVYAHGHVPLFTRRWYHETKHAFIDLFDAALPKPTVAPEIVARAKELVRIQEKANA